MVANVLGAIRELLDRLALKPADVLSLGIANQTETLVVWDREDRQAGDAGDRLAMPARRRGARSPPDR